VLAESRDLGALRAEFGQRAARAFSARAAEGLAETGLVRFPARPIPLSIRGAGGVPAFPALRDEGDSVALTVHADRRDAERLHPGGVRRLLRLALAERMKQARKQLPVQPKTALLYGALGELSPAATALVDVPKPQRVAGGGAMAAAMASARQAPAIDPATRDRLRADLVDGAFEALAGDGPGDGGLGNIRDADAFAALVETVGKALFPEAMRRLQQAEAILAGVAEVRLQLESKLIGWASGNLDDMRAQLAALVPPGFLRDVPAEALGEYPRYLKAIGIRLDKLRADPARDTRLMAEWMQAAAPWLRAQKGAAAQDPKMTEYRWLLEELRVSLFAQELRTRMPVSVKRLQKVWESMQR